MAPACHLEPERRRGDHIAAGQVYASHGSNNRTNAVRVPAPGRFEIRASDSAVNPHLAVSRHHPRRLLPAAWLERLPLLVILTTSLRPRMHAQAALTLAAGLEGIRLKLDPGPSRGYENLFSDSAAAEQARLLPRNLGEATGERAPLAHLCSPTALQLHPPCGGSRVAEAAVVT